MAAVTRQGPLRQRHIPQRTCVGCRTTTAKRQFVRIVRTAAGRVEVDLTGKKAGRGAYLCREQLSGGPEPAFAPCAMLALEI